MKCKGDLVEQLRLDVFAQMVLVALKERGLRTSRSRKEPPKPMSPSKVAYMLRNVFYVGVIDWKGEQYPGRHEPLVTPETWGKVQEILSSRDQSGERQRLHQHYLKGSVFCARCKRRLGFLVATGRNGGKYDYFFCYWRQAKNGCDLPFLTTTAVEEAVCHAYGDIELYDAEQQLLETAVDWDTVKTNLTLAMGLVSDCQQAYRRGGPRVRRRYNQAFWEAIYVDVYGVSYGRLATPFHQVLPSEITERVETTENPDQHRRGRGLSKNDLVEVSGLEPPTSTLRT